MPVGQFTGNRSKYVYTTDSGKSYILNLDDTLVMVNSGLTLYDPAAPGDAVAAPRRFKPRGVHWQATAAEVAGKRKFLISGTPDSGLYSPDNPVAITIDGFAGSTTGRRGEAQSF